MNKLQYVAAAAAFIATATCSFESRASHSRTVYVAVVAEGAPRAEPVPGYKSKAPPPYPYNRSQGRAVCRAVSHAKEFSTAWTNLAQHLDVKIIHFDDDGIAEKARAIATHMQSIPDIIAVLGHSSSTTTVAAAELYAEVGIPLLMPIATSPRTGYPGGDYSRTRLRNCFRIPASDAFQAQAIHRYLARHRRAKRVVVLCDGDPNNQDYVRPLAEDVLRNLHPLRTSTIGGLAEPVDLSRGDPRRLAEQVEHHRPDAIVFVGYGSTYNRFLLYLRDAYTHHNEESRPLVVLTDGCMIDDLRVDQFPTCIAFPVKPIGSISNDHEEASSFQALIEQDATLGQVYAYQATAYDAMLILAKALANSHQERAVTRDRVTRSIRTQRTSGLLATYSYGADGEPTVDRYYVYPCSMGENRKLSLGTPTAVTVGPR